MASISQLKQIHQTFHTANCLPILRFNLLGADFLHGLLL